MFIANTNDSNHLVIVVVVVTVFDPNNFDRQSFEVLYKVVSDKKSNR